MLVLLVIALVEPSASTLTCHCSGISTCSANGYCSGGCDLGWFGPGCQVGNVALNKTAIQSSTFNNSYYTGYASLAVDGLLPLPTQSAESCSHTVDTNQTRAWWYVTLNKTHDFVITSVTLVNRNDRIWPWLDRRLSDFVVLYSNETTGDPDPNNATWKEFARQSGDIGFNKTYKCNKTAIAKRVAVYMLNSSNPVLTLCEAQVFGYFLEDCPKGFTGPGCLLRACDDQCNSKNGTCNGEYGNCRYDVCPHPSLLPPDCWITLSDYSGVKIQSNGTCDTLQISVQINDSQANIPASMLLLQVSNHSNGMLLVNTTMSVFNIISYNYSYASAGATYGVSVTPIYCNISTPLCYSSTGSSVVTSTIGKREYWHASNNSCFLVHVNSSTAGYVLPTAVEITCNNNYTSVMLRDSSTFMSCGLEEDLNYECSIIATIDATRNRFERQTFSPVFRTKTTTETSQAENKAGIVAGSIVGVVVVLAIISAIAVVYSRRHKSTQTNTNEAEKGSAVVLSAAKVPSPCEEQYDNFYDSLDKRLDLESSGDYAQLK